MEITGKIIAVLPERSGQSARTGSTWSCGSFVLETMEQWPRKMCFDVFGEDKLRQFNLQVGSIVTISFEVDAREYEGKWFNSIRAWGCRHEGQAVVQPQAPYPTQAPVAQATQAPQPVGPASDSLPFPQCPY